MEKCRSLRTKTPEGAVSRVGVKFQIAFTPAETRQSVSF